MNNKEKMKQFIKAVVEDYSEFISYRATQYTNEIGKTVAQIDENTKKDMMRKWVEEFVEMASNNIEEENS